MKWMVRTLTYSFLLFLISPSSTREAGRIFNPFRGHDGTRDNILKIHDRWYALT